MKDKCKELIEKWGSCAGVRDGPLRKGQLGQDLEAEKWAWDSIGMILE